MQSLSSLGIDDSVFLDMDSFVSMSRKAPKLDENASASTRQKSCNTCVKGKRRCDKRSPRCSRCAAKGLDCVYQKLPPGAMSSMPATSAAPPPNLSRSTTVSVSDVTDMVPDLEMSGFDMDSYGMRSDTSPESLQTDPGLQLDSSLEVDLSFVDILTGSSNSFDGDTFPWTFTGFDDTEKMNLNLPLAPIAAPSVPKAAPPAAPLRDLSLYPIKDECLSVDPLLVHDERSRIGALLSQLTKLHIAFVKSRSTSFMHPRLWTAQMPETIMSAFTAANAYVNSTPETKGWTMKLLADASRSILDRGARATTPYERLARTAALLLVHLIRIYDGDVMSRASAEREVSKLFAWAEDLGDLHTELREGTGGLTEASKDTPPESWEGWILLESLRRTKIATMCSIYLYSLLKGEPPPFPPNCDEASFTASRHLWSATTSFAFYKAWREDEQYEISNFGFKKFWLYGRPDDLDDFTKLMLTAQVGPDAVDHFMSSGLPIVA